ncbi:MAG: metal-sensitive transcriptional regulator [Exilispira sp.]
MEHCDKKRAHHSKEFKENLVKRLNRIEGQIKGIKKMIESDCYCDDILNQISSIRSALLGVQIELLKGHIKTCILDQLKEGDLNVIDELSKTIRKMIL